MKTTVEIELYEGPEDGKRIDLPGNELPRFIMHFGGHYLNTEQTCGDGTPLYIYNGKVPVPPSTINRTNQI